MSSENPANDWLWAAFVALALEHSLAAAKILGQLQMVLFHACCHGSTRRKHTGWLSTPGVYEVLGATCQNDQVIFHQLNAEIGFKSHLYNVIEGYLNL